MTFRRLVLVTHRWVGLASMAFLAVLGATGSLMLLPRKPKIVGQLHTAFALGRRGQPLAEVVTIVGTALVLGGLVLWWRPKRLTVRVRSGWRLALNDLHHVTGVMTSLLLLVMCVSATVMWRTRVPPPPRPTAAGAAPPEPAEIASRRRLHRLARQLHAVEGMGKPIKLLYFVGSGSLVLLAVSGFTMWWKPRRRPDP
jgi:uncharacterized iron-regulated membrane protein